LEAPEIEIPEVPDPDLSESDENSDEEPEEKVASVRLLLDSMTLDQKVMQLMFVRLSGELAPTSVDNKLLKRLTPGGVILPQVATANGTIDYVQALRKIESKSSLQIPFFIAGNAFTITDNAVRNSKKFLHVPSMLTLSAAGKNKDTEKLFNTIADNFQRMGLNAHFGPSLTLSSSLSNARGSMNTFGADPEFTAAMSASLLNAFYEHDILWMPAGFPGGEANRTGRDPAAMLTPGPHYIERDGLPYFIAIRHGVPMLHVANTLVPTFDRDLNPASLSRHVIRTLLKGTLEYKGLVVAGPMDGPHILHKYEPEKAAIQSLQAGADLLLWSRTSPTIAKAIGSIMDAVDNGELDEEIIDDAVRRVLTLKFEFGLFDRKGPESKEGEKIAHENKKRSIMSRINKRGITLLKNDNGLLPFKEDISIPLFITGVIDLAAIQKTLEKELKFVNKFEIKTAKHTGRIQDFELRRLEGIAKGARVGLCIFDDDIDARTQAQVIKSLKKYNLRVVVVLLGNPKDISPYLKADALLLLHGSSNFLDSSTEVLTDILMGIAPMRVIASSKPLVRNAGQAISFNVLDVIESPTGRLPTELKPFFSVGHSMSYAPASIKRVAWDFGDSASSKEPHVDHTYETPGQYVATLTVETVSGDTETGSFNIEILE
jgi:beta-N-acetylhexosaminidase